MPNKNNIRAILLDLGVGDFNATMAIPYMLLAPRATDPSMVQMLVVVRKIQEALMGMGAVQVQNTGVLDAPTAKALDQICGPEWLSAPYYETIQTVLAAERAGHQFMPDPVIDDGPSATGDYVLGFLPDVPGGIVTYGVGAALLYWMLKKKKKR